MPSVAIEVIMTLAIVAMTGTYWIFIRWRRGSFRGVSPEKSGAWNSKYQRGEE